MTRLFGVARAIARLVGSPKRNNGPARSRRRSGSARPAGNVVRTVDRSEVQFAYEPDLDGTPDPGEVVWAWLPYEDNPSTGKDRPGVVVGMVAGDPSPNRSRDVAIVPLTSKHRPGQIPVGSGPWDPRRRPSEAKVDQIYRVPVSAVRREGSILERKVFDRVVAAIR